MTNQDPILTSTEYAVLVEQAPIMIWRAGTDGLCDYFNQRWTEFTGRSLEQEVGNGWAEGVHAEDLQGCLDYYLEHFEHREVFEMEYRLRRHDGAWRWILDRGVPTQDAQGAFTGYVGSCTDITERVEARMALAEAHASQIRILHGLLPICMLCKKIKNDGGYWEAIEHYISEHSVASFSHGLCPDCYPAYLARTHAEIEAFRQKGGLD